MVDGQVFQAEIDKSKKKETERIPAESKIKREGGKNESKTI